MRFADRIVADLRGYQDEAGRWPFWEAVGKHFFDMPFEDADRLNSLKGNQFIADLMPKYPIYTRLLPPEAQAAIGRPHRDGEAALKLLLEEGFFSEGYIDIFDAGPTVYARTDHLRAIRESVVSKIYRIEPLEGMAPSLIAKGQIGNFSATIGTLERLSPEGCAISPQAARTLGVGVGEEVRHVSF
jgi:arginine N-succinyltransferase